MKKQPFSSQLFLLYIIPLFSYFIYRLFDQSKMLFQFPLDLINDYSGHMAMLFFLKVCGFHSVCPYWYNGYTTFLTYTPGWSFFTYPLYLLTNNVLFSTYLSLLLLFLLAFLFIFSFGKKYLSPLSSLFFFLLVFANPISIGNFIRLGRMSEFFSWVFFIPLFFLILIYKEKEFDRFFYFSFIFFYFILMISHPLVIILSHIYLLGFFFVLSFSQKIRLLFCSLLGLLLSSFWWLPYLRNIFSTSILDYSMGLRALDFSGPWLYDNLVGILLSFTLLFVLFFYLKQIRSRREFLFLSPLLLLVFLYLFRFSAFLPVLRNVYPDSIHIFFLFFIVYYFLRLNFSSFSSLFRILFFSFLFFILLFGIFFSIIHTPFFVPHGDLEEDVLTVLSSLPDDSVFYILPFYSSTSYSNAYYSYAPIYLNLSSSGGWSYSEKDAFYVSTFKAIPSSLSSGSCILAHEQISFVHTSHILATQNYCSLLSSCGFSFISQTGDVCLFQT